MFTCSQCNRPHPEGDRVYQDTNWCPDCVADERQRLQQEDENPGLTNWGPLGKVKTYSRPPKYMLDPSEYGRFGYK